MCVQNLIIKIAVHAIAIFSSDLSLDQEGYQLSANRMFLRIFCALVLTFTRVTSDTPPKHPYQYKYDVKDENSGVDFTAKESSDGEVVIGSYSLVLPGGSSQSIQYGSSKPDRIQRGHEV